MVLEDFTTYTEVEPDDRIQKTAHHIDLYSRRLDADAYLYKDFTADHFGDFDHKVDAKLISGNWEGYIWGVNDEVDDIYFSQDSLGVSMHGANDKIYLYEKYGGTKYSTESSGTFTENTMYYFRIKKSGTLLTCDVYGSAADRDAETSKITALSVSLTLHADSKFRYMFACSNIPYGGYDYASTYDIENLDLQEVVIPPVGKPPMTLMGV